MIQKEELQPDNGRVTAGIPSLDSPKRFQRDTALISADFQKKIDAEIERNEQSSITPDGDKTRTVLEAVKGTQLNPAEFIRRLSALNPKLWFERAKAAPTEIGVYLKIHSTQDEPEGLRYLGGFSGVRPLNERDWVHTVKQARYVTDGTLAKRVIGTKIVQVQCHGCKECAQQGAIGGVIRGYRMLLKRLEDAKAITPTETEKMFGSGNTKNWQARHA